MGQKRENAALGGVFGVARRDFRRAGAARMRLAYAVVA